MEITIDQIKEKVAELGKDIPRHGCTKNTGWYQEIDLKGVITNANRLSNIDVWKRIRSLMPPSIEEISILDIGCNAGLYSIMAAIEGASVIGLESKKCWIDQANFVRSIFELDYGPLDIEYFECDISESDLTNFGHFDYIFAIGVASELKFHAGYNRSSYETIEAQIKLLSNLVNIGSNIIIRSRNNQLIMSDEYYDEKFKELSYKVSRRIPDAGGTILTLYSKSIWDI